MPKRITILLFIFLPTIYSFGQNKLGGIGQWREHFNNRSVIQIGIANFKNGQNKIIGASSQQIFSIGAKNSIELSGKSTGLNDVAIACTAWDEEQSQLILLIKIAILISSKEIRYSQSLIYYFQIYTQAKK